jgi:hypothetical protein
MSAFLDKYSLFSQLEPVGDLIVVQAGDDQAEDFLLTRCERIKPLEAGGNLGNSFTGAVVHRIDEFCRDLGGDLYQTGVEGADRGDELGGGDVLEQVARGAESQGILDVLILIVGGEHDDFDRRVLPKDLFGRLYPAEVGEVDIHENYIGLEFGGHADRCRPVLGDAPAHYRLDRRVYD